MEFNKEYLEKYSIYELRELARKFRIKRPTSKKKKQLIEEIILFNSGSLAEASLVPVNYKKGRPAKSIKIREFKNFDYDKINTAIKKEIDLFCDKINALLSSFLTNN